MIVMKNSFFAAVATVAIAFSAISCRSTDDFTAENAQEQMAVANKAAVAATFDVKVGVRTLQGVNTFSGSYDMGDVYATNVATGEIFYESGQNPGGFRTLPIYLEDLPAGTYEITAYQGQGGWVGYGTATVVVKQKKVGPDGYVKAFIPISWEE